MMKKPQLVKSLVIVFRAHVMKIYDNCASTLIIYEVNRQILFLPIICFPWKKYDISNQTNSFVFIEHSKSIH